ncbi:hypothetical protein ACFQV2_24750 [Actinokineospora soli]|uniref:Tat (Twin-arginine translocation) pathway signal sequence n=1 Tax=Actinokineospora soli TaxID=1048753 RepID=A0ABW2TSC8_9PSEU
MVTRRDFLIATGAGITSLAVGHASAAGSAPGITAYIGGAAVDRATVLEWEARRIQVAAERINRALPGAILGELTSVLFRVPAGTEDIASEREALADAKLRMGETAMRDLVAADLAVSGPAGELAAAPGQWAISTIGLVSTHGTATGFANWFRVADERAMLVACPDHYLIRSPRTGPQEVIEVTGGAVLNAQFFIDYTDTAGVPIAVDPRYPVRMAGWARSARGVRIGAVHHQFRDEPRGGFSAALAVAFPASLPSVVAEHRWHLACEFSNWVAAYVASTSGTSSRARSSSTLTP